MNQQGWILNLSSSLYKQNEICSCDSLTDDLFIKTVQIA